MENAKKNLVFHFGVGRQASSYQIDYVKLNTYLCYYSFEIQSFLKLHILLDSTGSNQVFSETPCMLLPKSYLLNALKPSKLEKCKELSQKYL